MQAVSGFRGAVKQFLELFPTTKVSQIIADNPYGEGALSILDDAASALAKGGELIIRGTTSNKYVKAILNGTHAQISKNFEIVQKATKVSSEIKAGMKQTNGKQIVGDVFEIILKKK